MKKSEFLLSFICYFENSTVKKTDQGLIRQCEIDLKLQYFD